MRSSSRKMPDPGFRFGVKRTGLASLLCAILRPGDAKAASVNAESVRLVVGSRSRDSRSARYRYGRGENGSTLGRHKAGSCNGDSDRIGPVPSRSQRAGGRNRDGKGRLVARHAGAADWHASLRPRPAGRICRSSEIRRRRYPPGPHARCAGGSRRLGGALAGLPVRCTGNPDAEGHPGVSGSARRCAFKSQRDFRRERAGPVARPVRPDRGPAADRRTAQGGGRRRKVQSGGRCGR